jgi:hypothetical protein
MTNRQIEDIVPRAWTAARSNTALRAAYVVIQTYDLFSSFESIVIADLKVRGPEILNSIISSILIKLSKILPE